MDINKEFSYLTKLSPMKRAVKTLRKNKIKMITPLHICKNVMRRAMHTIRKINVKSRNGIPKHSFANPREPQIPLFMKRYINILKK